MRENDTVYHLGRPVQPAGWTRRVEEIAEQLHGRIVLITGNHDRITPRIATDAGPGDRTAKAADAREGRARRRC